MGKLSCAREQRQFICGASETEKRLFVLGSCLKSSIEGRLSMKLQLLRELSVPLSCRFVEKHDAQTTSLAGDKIKLLAEVGCAAESG